jgi:inner membrane protein
MHLATHLLIGWTLTLPANLKRRDRALVVLASVLPDIDAIGAIGDLVQRRPLDSFELYATYHHALGHNALFAGLVALGCLLFAERHLLVGGLSILAIHLHLICDIVGAGGPDGSRWEVPYLLPFSSSWQLSVSWQWARNAWPNILLTTVLLAIALYAAWSRGYSPLGLFSERADGVLVATLRRRFGQPPGSTV